MNKKFDFRTIKTFEDACRKAGVSPKSLFTKKDTIDEMAYKKLKLIIAVINEGWKPDWKNTSEYKWHPWFSVRPGGFGFSDSFCDYWCTDAHCGSRLCLQTEEKADFVGKQFEDIYNEFLTIK